MSLCLVGSQMGRYAASFDIPLRHSTPIHLAAHHRLVVLSNDAMT
jgi:hypothetical protein